MSANLAGLRTLNMSDDGGNRNAYDDNGEDIGYEKYFEKKLAHQGCYRVS